MNRLRDKMTTGSWLSYLLWRGVGGKRDIVANLGSGERLIIRGGTLDDLYTGYEVFVREIYRPPESVLRQRVERIVDVGANVGYTTLYWSRLFCGACFKAFEPHPLILLALKANLALNRLSQRVLVFPAAAGTKNSVVKLTDAGIGSTVTQTPTGRSFEVSMMDFFETVANEPIDLLKLDCEGAEYDLVSDRRFADLRAKTMVFEWHATAERPHAKREIFKMLTLYKWRVEPISESGLSQPEFGLLNTGVAWAFNQN